MPNPGHVFLVGAGPGDPGLLTQKAAMLLAHADCVLYDYLIPPNALLTCKPDTELICVGKKKGAHSATQRAINERMVSEAKKGRRVVRLKGGDPLVFGRGGEEMSYLEAEGISYTVVPGVSAAMAVPASCAIPLTHRDYSRSVAFVTGTMHDGSSNSTLPVADTLVCLMALTGFETLVKRLKQHPPFHAKTPAALIQSGTTAHQKMVVGTLETLPNLHKKNPLNSPVLLIVGDVITTSQNLQHFNNLPLVHKRVVLLRAHDQCKDLYETLTLLGAEVILAPMIKLVPNTTEMAELTHGLIQNLTHIVFTSINGVRFFFESLIQNRIDHRYLSHLHITAIGPRTKSELESYGFYADVCPEEFHAKAVAQCLANNQLTNHHHVLLPTTDKADNELVEALAKTGATIIRKNIYSTQKNDRCFATLHDNDYVFFTSASTAEFACETGFWTTQNIHALSIGEKTTQTLRRLKPNTSIYTAQTATTDAMLNLLLNL